MSDRPKTTRFRKKDRLGANPADSQETNAPQAAQAAPKPEPVEPARETKKKPARSVEPMDRGALEDLASMDADDFAAAFAAAVGGAQPRRAPKIGETVEGVVVRVGSHEIFLDIGAKSEASIPLSEFVDDDGNPTVTAGDRITASLLSNRGGELHLSRKLSGAAARGMLDQAYEAGIPVEGRVSSRNPGGFVIDLGGGRGFCPVSQIDRFPGDDLDRFVGLTLSFAIIEMNSGEAVVSHRSIQEENLEEQAAEQWATLKPGDELPGVVRNVQPFGVFVDLGGAEGLVHRSELSWEDVADPSKVVSRGQQVIVTILEIDPAAKRMSLSMKDRAADPWSLLGQDFQEGEVYQATVRRLADFGAFADLAPGLTGLIHVGNIANEHVNHPGDVLKPGDQVNVRVLSIDHQGKRLDLGMKQAGADWKPPEGGARKRRDRPAQQPPAAGGFGTLGDLLKGLKVD